MKIVLALVTFLAVVTAQAKNLNPSVPSNVLAQNPQALADYLAEVEASDMSDEEKAAYKALVQSAEGDDVLELIDEETLKWYYGADSNLAQSVSKVSSGTNVNSCLKYALCVHVSKSKQRMYAYYYGKPIQGIHNTPVSTARPGKYTPTGTFSIGELAGRWRVSNLYSGAALYYAMQLNGNIFIHATSKGNYSALGTPASAGCVRTTLAVAEPLNKLMRQVGRGNIRVVVSP